MEAGPSEWWQWLLVALGAYVLLSLLLLRFPLLLWRPKRRPRLVVDVGAHRGGCGERPENTLAAFANAVRAGSHLLELDVHLTADKRVVVLHDESVHRVTGVAGSVAHFRYAELPRLPRNPQLPFPFHETHPPRFVPEWAAADNDPVGGDTRIPLLEDVFAAFPDAVINIDLKTPSDELAVAVNELIVSAGREDRTIWGSSHHAFNQQLGRLNPRVARFCSAKRVLHVFLSFLFGLLPFLPFHEDALELPLFAEPVYQRNAVKMFGGRRAAVLMAVFNWVVSSPRLYAHLRRRGVRVIFFVLNTREGFQRAWDLGADGIMTDYPSLLAEAHRARALPHSPSSSSTLSPPRPHA